MSKIVCNHLPFIMGSFPSSLRPGFLASAESAVFLKLGWMQLAVVGFEFATGEGEVD